MAMTVDPERRKTRRWSIKTYVRAIICIIALPLCAAYATSEYREHRGELESASNVPHAHAIVVAAETDQLIDDVRQTLDALARNASIRAVDPARCGPAFDGYSEQRPHLGSLLLVDAGGREVCTSIGTPGQAFPRADEDWFRSVAAGSDFAVGGPNEDEQTRHRVARFAVPVRTDDGRLSGVLVRDIDFAEHRPSLLRGSLLPAGSAVGFVDARGRAFGNVGTSAQTALPPPPEFVARIVREHAGNGRASAPDGTEFVYGYAPLARAPWVAVVALPAETLVGGIEREGQRNAILFFTFVLAGLAGTTILVMRLLGPLVGVADTMRRARLGDPSARVTPRGPAEIAAIGGEFNRLLDKQLLDQKALQTSEERYRQLVETARDAVLLVNRDLRIVFANGAVEAMFGHQPEAMIGRNPATLQPERLHTRLPEQLGACFASPERCADVPFAESVGLHRDGHEFPIEVACSLVRVRDDDVVVSYIRDITQRKQDELNLRESEARFRAIADSSPALVWMIAPDGRIEFVNAAWLEYTGQSQERALAGDLEETLSRYDRDRWRQDVGRALADRRAFRIECRRKRHDGAYRWFAVDGAPRYGGDGQFAGLIGTCIDIHERVVSEHRLRSLTDMHSALAEAGTAIARLRQPKELCQRICDILLQYGGFTTAWIALVDADRQWVRAVAASGRTFGYFDRFAVRFDESDPLFSAPSMDVLRTGRRSISNDRQADPRTAVVRGWPGDAETRSSAAFPLRRNDVVVGVLAVFAGETGVFDEEMSHLLGLLAAHLSAAFDTIALEERRDVAEAALRLLNATLEDKVVERTRSLEVANRELATANSELESFSYSVSHDLRAPLRSISGFSDLLLQRETPALDAEARGYLARVKAASVRMTTLINDLLVLARISRTPIKRTTVDLSEVAASAVDHLRESDPGRDVAVSIAPNLTAEADPGLARILLVNLLDNAWKFTARREHAGIEVGCAEIDGTPAFFVRDNGAGFNVAYADKLFAPFQRLHSEQEFAGTGIGLAIVQRICHRHGGRIWAASEEGASATFWFTLRA